MSKSMFFAGISFPKIPTFAFLGLAPLLLTGCAALQVRMGTRVYLAKTPVVAMSVRQAGEPGIAPGQKAALVVEFPQPDGNRLFTEGAAQGKVMWRELEVISTVVTANQKGTVTLPEDPRLSDGKMPHVTVTVPSHPELRAELDIPLRYDRSYSLDFNASNGAKGFDGSSGTDGAGGSTGSMDPEHPSAGGNGSNGGNGGDGQNGWPGGDAPDVEIQVAFRPGPHPLLQSVVLVGRQKDFFLIDPQGGALTVTADGGSGGAGGTGGRAGRGGSGGIGSPNGSSGLDGRSGSDGSRGRDGHGGSITVVYDPQAKPYLSALHLSSRNGPHPAFIEKPMAPLW
jgi:hypothetical protein